jgi:hypothetical protein
MIEHIILFRWKDDASPEAIATALEELRQLKDKIPNITELICGENFSERSKGYTHALVVRFPNRKALEVYGPHPEHQRVVQTFINPIRADVIGIDFEFQA